MNNCLKESCEYNALYRKAASAIVYRSIGEQMEIIQYNYNPSTIEKIEAHANNFRIARENGRRRGKRTIWWSKNKTENMNMNNANG